ncbi:MAG: hypothetical protein ABJL67_20775, partial [Sulfitobacter sp.]
AAILIHAMYRYSNRYRTSLSIWKTASKKIRRSISVLLSFPTALNKHVSRLYDVDVHRATLKNLGLPSSIDKMPTVVSRLAVHPLAAESRGFRILRTPFPRKCASSSQALWCFPKIVLPICPFSKTLPWFLAATVLLPNKHPSTRIVPQTRSS